MGSSVHQCPVLLCSGIGGAMLSRGKSWAGAVGRYHGQSYSHKMFLGTLSSDALNKTLTGIFKHRHW